MTWSLLTSPFSLSADRLPHPWGQWRVHTAKEQDLSVSLETAGPPASQLCGCGCASVSVCWCVCECVKVCAGSLGAYPLSAVQSWVRQNLPFNTSICTTRTPLVHSILWCSNPNTRTPKGQSCFLWSMHSTRSMCELPLLTPQVGLAAGVWPTLFFLFFFFFGFGFVFHLTKVY